MKLLTLVLLLVAPSEGSCEVVDDFVQTCRNFFANPGGVPSPPTVFTEDNYKQICQVRDNTYEYATLYDTANRIPVYSAYKFEGLKYCTRNNNWYIEPQLENGAARREMESDKNVTSLEHQAVNADYKGTRIHGYAKEHLAPVCHARSQDCSDATFTLTNAAPQNNSFNSGYWRTTEKDVANVLTQNCLPNSAYIVTGVVPGNKPPLKNRVRIPSHFWTAYCCLDNNLRVKSSGGFLGHNVNFPVQNMSIKVLQGKLTTLYGQLFRIFGGNCYESSSDSPK